MSHYIAALLASLIAAVQPLNAGSVYPENKPLTQPGVRLAIPSKGGQCQLETAGDSFTSEPAPNQFHFEIRLTCGKATQVLTQWSGAGWDEPKMELISSGDFDGDGLADLDIELSAKYSMSRRVLFLSSKAGPGELVGEAVGGRDVQEYLLRRKPPARDNVSVAAEKFIKLVQYCLERRDAACLSKHIAAEVYFPDFSSFGCQTKAPKSTVANKYSGADIAACAMTSTIQHDKAQNLTLFQVLEHCFNSPQPLTTASKLANGQTIETDSGFSCHFQKEGESYLLNGVAVGE